MVRANTVWSEHTVQSEQTRAGIDFHGKLRTPTLLISELAEKLGVPYFFNNNQSTVWRHCCINVVAPNLTCLRPCCVVHAALTGIFKQTNMSINAWYSPEPIQDNSVDVC